MMSNFVICINNDSNPASLILAKVYRVLPDGEAASRNMLRVLDEDISEPDGYLYPASMFVDGNGQLSASGLIFVFCRFEEKGTVELGGKINASCSYRI